MEQQSVRPATVMKEERKPMGKDSATAIRSFAVAFLMASACPYPAACVLLVNVAIKIERSLRVHYGLLRM
jgi:hypothetical protein